MHPQRRRTDRQGYSVPLIGLVLVVAAATVFASASTFYVLQSANSRADRAADTAREVRALLVSDKVCTDTNQGAACRALFDRLARSLTREQRFRLACDGLAALHDPDAARIYRRAGCQPAP